MGQTDTEERDWPGTSGMFGPCAGAADHCVCILCGHREKYEEDKPCQEMECSNCGKVTGLKYDEDLKIDLGYKTKAPAGFLGIDMYPGYGDIMYDLNQGIPVPSNRASVIRAWHLLEYIVDRSHIMEEVWYVLKDKGRFVFEVPSTEGQGAFADPNYKSFWNELSFRFYIEDDLRASINTRAKFRIVELGERTDEEKGSVFVRGILEAVKEEDPKGLLETDRPMTRGDKAVLDALALAGKTQEEIPPDEARAFEDAIGAKTKVPGFSVFKTIKGEDGRDYWVSISGSAFLDLEKEIISQEALDHAIHFHDATGMRGPLRIYHFDETEVGECLISLRVRNFLIEAGYWYDGELADEAKEWSENEDSDPAVSVGFFFVPDDFVGNIYQKVIIFERSLVRAVDAACPWTLLKSIKEVEVGTKEQLAAIVGEENAEEIVSQAATKSKELEEEGVAFKDTDGSEDVEEKVDEADAEESEEPEASDADEEDADEEEDVAPEVESEEEEEDESEEAGDEEEEEESKTVEELVLPEESVKALVDAFAETVAPRFEALTTSVEEVKTGLTALEEDLGARVAELEKPIAEKVKEELDLQPKVVVRRATRSKEADTPLVPVVDPSKGVDYENETPEERAKRLDAYWAEKRMDTENEVDLGE